MKRVVLFLLTNIDEAGKLCGSPVSAGGTLAAWLERQMDQPPKPGQTIRHYGLEFEVRRVKRRRIFEVSASVKSQS